MHCRVSKGYLCTNYFIKCATKLFHNMNAMTRWRLTVNCHLVYWIMWRILNNRAFEEFLFFHECSCTFGKIVGAKIGK